MRLSQPSLRAISSPSAELGVDVGGRIGLRSAFLPHINQDPEFPSSSRGHFVRSIDAWELGSPTSPLVGDPSRTVAAPQPISKEEKSI